MPSDSYNLGSLFMEIGIDTQPVQNAFQRIEYIITGSIQRASLAYTESLSKSFSKAGDALMGGFKNGFSGGLKGIAKGFAKGSFKGIFAGGGAAAGAIFAEAMSSAIQISLMTRLDMVKGVLFGYMNTVVKGLMNYGVEERAINVSNFILGTKEGYINNPEQVKYNAENMDSAITELATELSYTRVDVAKIAQALSQSGATYADIVGGNTKRTRAEGLLAQTAYLAEAVELNPGQIEEASRSIRQVKSAFPELSYDTIANQILGLATNTQAPFATFKFAFQDAIPAASAANIDIKDTMQSLSMLFRFSTPEVSGTLAKAIFQNIAQPGKLDRQILNVVDSYEENPGGFVDQVRVPGQTATTIRGLWDKIDMGFMEGKFGNLPGAPSGTSSADYYNSLDPKVRNQMIEKKFIDLFGASDTIQVGLRPFTTMSQEDVDGIRDSLEKFSQRNEEGDSTLQALVKIRQSGVKGAFDTVGSSIDNVVSSLGKKVSPGVVVFVNFIKEVANQLTEGIERFTAPLENISNRLGTLFSNNDFLDRVVAGMETTLSVVGGIFERWVDLIADFATEGDNVDSVFIKLNGLIVTFVQVFDRIFQEVKALLPLISDLTDATYEFRGKLKASNLKNNINSSTGVSDEAMNFAAISGQIGGQRIKNINRFKAIEPGSLEEAKLTDALTNTFIGDGQFKGIRYTGRAQKFGVNKYSTFPNIFSGDQPTSDNGFWRGMFPADNQDEVDFVKDGNRFTNYLARKGYTTNNQKTAAAAKATGRNKGFIDTNQIPDLVSNIYRIEGTNFYVSPSLNNQGTDVFTFDQNGLAVSVEGNSVLQQQLADGINNINTQDRSTPQTNPVSVTEAGRSGFVDREVIKSIESAFKQGNELKDMEFVTKDLSTKKDVADDRLQTLWSDRIDRYRNDPVFNRLTPNATKEDYYKAAKGDLEKSGEIDDLRKQILDEQQALYVKELFGNQASYDVIQDKVYDANLSLFKTKHLGSHSVDSFDDETFDRAIAIASGKEKRVPQQALSQLIGKDPDRINSPLGIVQRIASGDVYQDGEKRPILVPKQTLKDYLSINPNPDIDNVADASAEVTQSLIEELTIKGKAKLGLDLDPEANEGKFANVAQELFAKKEANELVGDVTKTLEKVIANLKEELRNPDLEYQGQRI